MKGRGAQDDFQEQIKATVDDRLALARHALNGEGSEDCVDCGNPIPLKRRLAYPAATRCIACQTISENSR